MKLYLIRHGRQNSTLCNVNADLSPEGIRQAEALKNRLRNCGFKYDAIYASTLIRAEHTARIINYNELNINIREGIKEIDFGELTGHTDTYIHEHFSEFEILRKSAVSDIPFPGGECGSDVFGRAKPVIDEIVAQNYENVLIVSHGGTIRSLTAGLLGIDFSKKLLFGKNLENCSITCIEYNRAANIYTLELFNDYSHLEAFPELLRGAWKK